jgi:hypothetical protein
MRIGSNAGHSTRTAAASGAAMQSAPTGHSDEDDDDDDDDDNTDTEDAPPMGAGADSGPLPDAEGVPDIVREDCDGDVRADAPSAAAAVEATLERAGEEERELATVLAIMAAAEGDDDKEEADEDAGAVELEEGFEDGGGDAGRYERRAKSCASVKICAKNAAKTQTEMNQLQRRTV